MMCGEPLPQPPEYVAIRRHLANDFERTRVDGRDKLSKAIRHLAQKRSLLGLAEIMAD